MASFKENKNMEQTKAQNNPKSMTCSVCALHFDTFDLFCSHMLDTHNKLREQGGEKNLNKYNCIMCDTDFNSNEDLNMHYSHKHVYCHQCKDFLTDEDALQKHNIKEHGDMPNDHSKDAIKEEQADPEHGVAPNVSLFDNSEDAIKEEPDSLIIKEEPIDF